jgi:hypothetical protein
MKQCIGLDVCNVEHRCDTTRDGCLACARCAGHEDPPRTQGQGCHGIDTGIICHYLGPLTFHYLFSALFAQRINADSGV